LPGVSWKDKILSPSPVENYRFSSSFLPSLSPLSSLKQSISAGHVTAFSFVLKLVVTSKDICNAVFKIDGSVLK